MKFLTSKNIEEIQEFQDEQSVPPHKEVGRAVNALSFLGIFSKTKRAWRKAVRDEVKNEDSFSFCAPAIRASDKSRPLMILIHPGDAIEDGIGMRHSVARDELIAFGERNIAGMAKEIRNKIASHDLVILHRQSSVDVILPVLNFSKPGMQESYKSLCLLVSEIGTVLCGDDLKLASKWIIENLDPSSRPEIFMAGAYACDKFGCITAVGKYLQVAGCEDILLSDFSPTDNSNFSPRWIPERTKINYEITRDDDDEGFFCSAYSSNEKDELGGDLCLAHLHVPDRNISKNSWSAGDVYVSDKHRRQGIATHLYKIMEEKLLIPSTPSTLQSEDAKKFWGNRNVEATKKIISSPGRV